MLIPARLASTRLPNKPLADIAGLPMIVRVARRVLLGLGDGAGRVVVAADDQGIIDACHEYGVSSLLTRRDHPSGSDRLAEASAQLGLGPHEIVVNVQGDEPLIDPDLVSEVAKLLEATPQASMSTAAHPIKDKAEFFNPNVVKVVVDHENMACYFSRAAIPLPREDQANLPEPAPLRHIGIYGYRVGFLQKFPRLTQAPTERIESLEQLRALWHGHRVVVHITDRPPGIGVDTPEDLERVRRQLMA